MRKILLTIFAFLQPFAFFAEAPLSASSVGTTGANFLKIPVAAIPTALGNTYTAMIGPDSILYNPGALGMLTYNTFSGAHNQYFVGINQEYVSLTYRTPYGTAAAAYSVLNSGKIKSYDLNENPIGTVTTSHKCAVFSFSQSFPHFNRYTGMVDPMVIPPSWSNIETVEEYLPKSYRFSVGGSLKYIGERLDTEKSSAYTFDAGTLLVLPGHLQLGFSALNLGGSQKFYSDEANLPRTIRAGVAKVFRSKKNLMTFAVMSDLVNEEDYGFYQSVAIEMSVFKMLQLRLGYRGSKDEGSRLSGGFGMNFDKFTTADNFIKGIRLDYSYYDYGVLGSTHRFGFQFIW